MYKSTIHHSLRLKLAVFIALAFVASSVVVSESSEPAEARELCKIFGAGSQFSNFLWNPSNSEMRVQASSGVADFTNEWTPDSRWNFARVKPNHTTDGWRDHPGDEVCDLDFFWAKQKIRIHEPVCTLDERDDVVGCSKLEWPWKRTLGAKKWHKVERHWRYITCFSGTAVPTDNTALRCFASPDPYFDHFTSSFSNQTVRLAMNPMPTNFLNPFDRGPGSYDIPRGGEVKSTTSNVTTCPTKWSRCPTS